MATSNVLKPQIINRWDKNFAYHSPNYTNSRIYYEFRHPFNPSEDDTASDVASDIFEAMAVESMGIVDKGLTDSNGRDMLAGPGRYVAVHKDGKWHTVNAYLYYWLSNSEVHFVCVYIDHLHDKNEHFYDKMAFPIDPRMTATDIEGANRIYKNADNTGWLFAHADADDHHDRVFTLKSVITSLFREYEDQALQKLLPLFIGGTSTEEKKREEYTLWKNLTDFRDHCIELCVDREKGLHIGQHIQEDKFHIQQMASLVIRQSVFTWKSKRDKAAAYASIDFFVRKILVDVNTVHNFETRWDRQSRLDAAAKAAKEAAESEGNENE